MSEPVPGNAATRKAETQAQFSRLAAEYDATGPGIFAHFGRRLVELVGVALGQQVLDVATGRGAVLFPAAERVGPTGQVIGVDLAEGMVQLTAAEVAHRGARASVRVMDAEELGFPDATFDRVCCAFGVMFFPDLARALGEFRRVLKPGGQLGVSTWQVSQTEDITAVLGALGFQERRPPGWIADPARLEAVLVEAGFAAVQVRGETHEFHYGNFDAYWESARGTGQRGALDRLTDAQREQVRIALADRLRPHSRGDGLHVPATALLATARR